MPFLKDTTFVCIDCEATGLDPMNDQIVEVAIATFTLDGIIDSFETLIDPGCAIPQHVIDVHHITNDMVLGKPKIDDVLGKLLPIIGRHPIVGHGIHFDIALLVNAAKRLQMPCTITNNPSFDTVRLARLYGESPSNSLEQLRVHFNIQDEGAHRAMSDVIVNVQVFKKLATNFRTLKELDEALARPIQLKNMPLGKHKGRPLKELPQDYLLWAAHQKFDNDLLFSLRSEVNRRKKGTSFSQASNPFSSLS